MARLWVVLLLSLLLCPNLPGEPESLLSISAAPFAAVPLGSSAELFKMGYGLEVSALYLPASLRILGFRLGGDFVFLPIVTTDSIWVASGFLGPVLRLPVGTRVTLGAHLNAGYYYFGAVGWEPLTDTGGGLRFGAGVGGTFQFTKAFALGAAVSFDYYSKLYNGIGASLTSRLDFPVATRRQGTQQIRPQPLDETTPGLEFSDISIPPIFPVLYAYYDRSPAGTVTVRNSAEQTARDIRITVFVERYMDNPMESGSAFSLEPKEKKTLDLFALFTEDLMEVTEGTKASAKITLSYTMGGEPRSADETSVVEFYHRNAMTWDDDRKIASFITAKDPTVLGFAKGVSTWMQEVKNPALDENLQKGMAIFEAIKAYGIRYEFDPTTPYAQLSAQRTAIDFLQFPRQTLQYTNGDCDDLSSLYTSLLEAIGVETAVIVVPGHIYTAFALLASPEEARRPFSRMEELIITNGKVWIPVETTLCQGSFEEAWQLGARQWRENSPKNRSRLYRTRDSWQVYQAVGFREGPVIQPPDKAIVTSAFVDTVARYVAGEIRAREPAIRQQIERSNSPHVHENALAVLYATYGLYDRALETLESVVRARAYAPALINMGNVFLIRGEYQLAQTHYRRALEADSRNAAALLGVSRCSYEQGDSGTASRSYQQLKTLDPALARRFSYLDQPRGEQATRSADAAAMRGTVFWEDEEQ